MLIPILETQTPIVPLADVKSYLNEINDDKDAEITSIINAMVTDAEININRKLSVTRWELYLPSLYDGFELPQNPINEITKIEFMDESGNYQLFDSANYYLYEELELGKVKLLADIPSISHRKAIKITFESGYTTIPEPIVTYIKYKCLCVYDAREETINAFVDSLLNKYRIRAFA